MKTIMSSAIAETRLAKPPLRRLIIDPDHQVLLDVGDVFQTVNHELALRGDPLAKGRPELVMGALNNGGEVSYLCADLADLGLTLRDAA